METTETVEITPVEKRLTEIQQLISSGEVKSSFAPPLVAGIDLGTSNIQMIVLDAGGEAVAARFQWDSSVRDGIVVDYAGARQVVADFKQQLEEQFPDEISLDYAAVGYPPGTEPWVESNVVKDCRFEVIGEISEPSAAAAALEIDQGVIVDVGGGTTGISIVENGQVIHTADEATGGHHLSLVISGNQGIDYEAAEKFKITEPFSAYRGIVQPVVEKMASIVEKELVRFPQKQPIYLVGGTVIPEGFETIFADVLQKPVLKPNNPIVITPLGIALWGVDRLNS